MRKKKKLKGRYDGGMVDNPTLGGKIANVIITLVVIFLAAICLLPMWHVLMSSISDGFSLLSYKGLVWKPVGKVNLEGYKLVLQDSGILTGYLNTIIYVVGTTGLGFILNVMGGYALSRPTKLSGAMTVFIMFTLMFSGGMIPTYMVMKTIGLVGTRWAVIFSEATMAMYVVIACNAFKSVPEATVEAARIDGAGHFRIMFQIMFPQCKSLFTVTLLNTFIGSWNSWLTASIYVPGDRSKWPLQLVINELTSNNVNFLESANPNYSRYLVQFAVIIVATLPILIAIPFFQDKIEAGVIQGGVKG
ncbi:MAG: carbohydrate ABC transporter permease [Eubacteriales bacterium]|nr:carbohydrate ABC transporter permease [Eubacteriales bacterium]